MSKGSKSIYARILRIISDARNRDTESAHILRAISDVQEREKIRQDSEMLFPLARELGRSIGEAIGKSGVALVFNDESAQLLHEAIALLLRVLPGSFESHYLHVDIRTFLKKLRVQGFDAGQSTET